LVAGGREEEKDITRTKTIAIFFKAKNFFVHPITFKDFFSKFLAKLGNLKHFSSIPCFSTYFLISCKWRGKYFIFKFIFNSVNNYLNI